MFVLPTLSDGFAITQLEAMAHGLPVVATPNCGRVVTDGEDGLIVPPADADALASAIDRWPRTRPHGGDGRRASDAVRRFSIAAAGLRLTDLGRAAGASRRADRDQLVGSH